MLLRFSGYMNNASNDRRERCRKRTTKNGRVACKYDLEIKLKKLDQEPSNPLTVQSPTDAPDQCQKNSKKANPKSISTQLEQRVLNLKAYEIFNIICFPFLPRYQNGRLKKSKRGAQVRFHPLIGDLSGLRSSLRARVLFSHSGW